MGLFGKKKKSGPAVDAKSSAEVNPDVRSDTAKPDADNASVSKAKSKKKKKSPMFRIFHESVWETVRTDMQNNELFIYEEKNGQQKYVGMVLNVEDIGGLDKRSRKNEAKGTLIECINSGRIKTYITEDLMDESSIMFVPEAITLSAMDEFSLLTDAKYELAFVDMAGNIELLGIMTTYKEVCDLTCNDGSVSVLLKDLEDEVSADDDDVVPEDIDLLSGSPAGGSSDSSVSVDNVDKSVDKSDTGDTKAASDVVESIGSDDIEPLDDDDDIEPLDDEVEAGLSGNDTASASTMTTGMPRAGMTDSSVTNPDMDAYEAAMQEEPVQEVENTVPSEWTNETVTRRFYSDDLGLEVSTDPFDAMFLHQNVFIPFDANRPDGWINEQLNEMARQANAEMEQMHQNNLFILRERYFKLLAAQCDRISKDLDISSESTQYGQMLMGLKQSLDDERNNIGVRVDHKKTEMEQRWRTKLQEIGMDAARAAQHQYRERYGKQHELEIYGIEESVRAAIEADFNDSVHDLYNRRRMEAYSLLDISITETLDELSTMYQSCMEEEQVRYRELQDAMHAFVEENRAADIVRMNTLAEDLRQKERADQVLADQTAKIRTIMQDHARKRQELTDEISKIRADNQATIESLKRENEDRVAKIQEEKDSLQARFDELLDKYANLDNIKDREYEERIEELRDEIFSWEDKCDHLTKVHNRSSLHSVFFMISAVIAALFVGFVGGEFVSIDRQTKSEYRAIVEDHEKQMENASENSDESDDDSDDNQDDDAKDADVKSKK